MKRWLSFILILSTYTFIAQVSLTSKFDGYAKKGGNGELGITLNKGSINSFAKYQIEFPMGVTIADIDSKGGNFTSESDKCKIVWVTLPTDASFNIKLKVSFTDGASFPITLYQKFYYLENGVKKEVQADPMIITSSDVAIEMNKNNPSNNSTPPTNSNTVATEPVKNNVVIENKTQLKSVPTYENNEPEEKNKPVTKTNTETKKTPTPTNENKPINTSPVNKTTSEDNCTYKIQIAACTAKPTEQTYSNIGKINIEQHGSLYKVVLSKDFKSKEDALKYKEQVVQKGYKDAFVVKYLNGQRVN